MDIFWCTSNVFLKLNCFSFKLIWSQKRLFVFYACTNINEMTVFDGYLIPWIRRRFSRYGLFFIKEIHTLFYMKAKYEDWIEMENQISFLCTHIDIHHNCELRWIWFMLVYGNKWMGFRRHCEVSTISKNWLYIHSYIFQNGYVEKQYRMLLWIICH